jgi:hypothetical protein
VVPPCSDRISRVPPYSRIVCTLRIRGYHPLWPDFPDRSTYLQTTTGLFRVRSPLLAESLLMSFPPGTEMFQFPGFASTHYVFMCRYPLPGGLPHSDIHGSTPARGSPWLFAACHVLHRLLVPRHPPNALLILDIPAASRRKTPHHAQKPSSGAVVRVQSSVARSNRDGNDRLFEDSPGNIYSAHNRILSNRSSVAACASTARNSTKSFTTPLNPRRQPLGCYPHRQHSRSDNSAERRISGQWSVVNGQSEDCLRRTIHKPPITRVQRRTRT